MSFGVLQERSKKDLPSIMLICKFNFNVYFFISLLLGIWFSVGDHITDSSLQHVIALIGLYNNMDFHKNVNVV